MIKGLQDSH